MDQSTTAADEARTWRKVTLRIVPFLAVCYLAAYLDRVNVGFAKLQMLSQLEFDEAIYGFGAGIFFLGYTIFEIPSNVLLLRVGPRLWIARIMLTWGLISGAMVFVKSPVAFYVMRFLLGVAEAGFVPGILLYLTYWFPAASRGRITAAFLSAIPVATIVGGPVSGWILKSASGAGGLAGWQWLFLIEAVPSLVLGVATLFYLDNTVADAKWLEPGERRLVADAVRGDAESSSHANLSAAFTDSKVWLLGAIYFGIVCGIYIVSFFLPTLIKQTGVTDPLDIGLLTAIPYLVAIAVMLAATASSDRRRERRWHMLAAAAACGLGLAVTAAAGHSTVFVLVGMSIAAAGAAAAQATFWCIPPAFLAGAAAAAGIALVNSLGNIAGFVATFMVGWMTSLTHSSASALYLFAAIVAAGGLLVLAIPARVADR